MKCFLVEAIRIGEFLLLKKRENDRIVGNRIYTETKKLAQDDREQHGQQ